MAVKFSRVNFTLIEHSKRSVSFYETENKTVHFEKQTATGQNRDEGDKIGRPEMSQLQRTPGTSNSEDPISTHIKFRKINLDIQAKVIKLYIKTSM